jgi:methylmalonyl-CoA mutase, N-terminal domain
MSIQTLSGLPVAPLYSGSDTGPEAPPPGQFPYTRGIHPGMYRDRLWTMRQFAGFSTPEETNARYRYLLRQGQTGLSVAFDLPTLMGLDADAPEALGEVGKCGVAISTIADMEQLFDGIPLDRVSVSMTINSPAPVIYAMYLVAAERQGVDQAVLSGTLQNDILKEYIAQKEFIYPPRPSFRLAVDAIEYSVQHTPKYNPISISGYHIREAGSTAVQELAFTLRDGFEYIHEMVARGYHVDQFASRLSFFFNAHNDLFEEVAKYRAARKIWAETLASRYGAKDERSLKLRFHAQTAGCSLTWQQPHNNLIRTTVQALAAVLGGAQSLHTNSLDEALALPSEQAVTLALRTQQILAHESNITATPDPLGGSYYVEALTARLEEEAAQYIREIDEMGGMLEAIERGYPQRHIAQASYEYQKRVESGDQIVVGVNSFTQESDPPIEILQLSDESGYVQSAKLRQFRASRNEAQVRESLDALRRAASDERLNTMPYILDAVRAPATLGEICGALRDVFGGYQESSIL